MGLLNTTYESVACNNTILSGMCLGQILATVVQVFERQDYKNKRGDQLVCMAGQKTRYPIPEPEKPEPEPEKSEPEKPEP